MDSVRVHILFVSGSKTYIFLSYNDVFLKYIDFCKPIDRIF